MASGLRARITRGDLRLVEVVYPGGLEMPRHAHEVTQVTLVLAGGVAETVGRRCVEAGPLSVGLKPAGVEHADRFARGGLHTVTLNVRPAFVAGLDGGGALGGWTWLQGGAPTAAMVRLLRRLRDAPDAAGAWLDDAVTDVLGTLARDARVGAARHVPPWLARARERLADEYARGVRTRELAAEAGVHPVYLARAFRRHYGESVSEHVRRLRVRAAAELLAHTDLPLAQVADAAGFADQSHLGRVLRAEAASTPAALRALAACRGRGSDRSR